LRCDGSDAPAKLEQLIGIAGFAQEIPHGIQGGWLGELLKLRQNIDNVPSSHPRTLRSESRRLELGWGCWRMSH
jgi:hypothetical protein